MKDNLLALPDSPFLFILRPKENSEPILVPSAAFQNMFVEKYPHVWEFQQSPCPMPYWGNANEAEKIVASTDESLGLPTIPKTLINSYIINQGELGDLKVMGSEDDIEVNSGNEVKMVLHGVRI